MVTRLAEQISQSLLSSNVIEEGDKDLYVYGFFLLISKVAFFFITVIVGFILGVPVASVVFYVLFLLLRGYAGGIHAKTEAACTFFTSLAIVLSIASMKLMLDLGAQVIPALMTVFASISIFCLSPLDTPQKPLKESERKYYRKVTRLLLGEYLLLLTVAWCHGWKNVAYAIIVCLFLESLLLLAGKIHNKTDR